MRWIIPFCVLLRTKCFSSSFPKQSQLQILANLPIRLGLNKLRTCQAHLAGGPRVRTPGYQLFPCPVHRAPRTQCAGLGKPAPVLRSVVHCQHTNLLAIASDPKHLGAQIGVIAILHTWGTEPAPGRKSGRAEARGSIAAGYERVCNRRWMSGVRATMPY